jgi:hypothetical protein
MPQVMVVARNFMDMVAALPASKLDMLYDSAFICEAVLRSKIHIFCSALFVLSAFIILIQLSLQVTPTTGKEICTADVVRVGTGDRCSYGRVGAQ